MGCLNDWMWEHTTQSCLSGTFPQRYCFTALCHLLLNITGNHTCTSLALNLPQGKSHNSIKLKHYWWCTVTDQRFAFIIKTKRCEEYSLLVKTRLWHCGLRYKMQYFFFSSFTWTYMNLPVTELLKCENHANPHQHLYMAGMWRGPWQMCNSNSFVAPCALYLSQESYYLPGWAEKYLKHDNNNNKVNTSQLVSLLQNTSYFSFAKRVLVHLISLMNTIKTTMKVRHTENDVSFAFATVQWIKGTKVWTKSLVSDVRIYNIVDPKTLRRT